jgi:hypothetical protein
VSYRVLTSSHQVIICHQTVEVEGCIFHKCNEFNFEHYLASPPYSACQNMFRDTYWDHPVPNKLPETRLLTCFRETGSVLYRQPSGRPSVLNGDSSDGICQTLFYFFNFNVNYFLTKESVDL